MKNFFDKLVVTLGLFSPIIILILFVSAYLYKPANQKTNNDIIKTNSETLKKNQYQSFRPFQLKCKKTGMPMQGGNLFSPHFRFTDSKFSHNQYTLTI